MSASNQANTRTVQLFSPATGRFAGVGFIVANRRGTLNPDMLIVHVTQAESDCAKAGLDMQWPRDWVVEIHAKPTT